MLPTFADCTGVDASAKINNNEEELNMYKNLKRRSAEAAPAAQTNDATHQALQAAAFDTSCMPCYQNWYPLDSLRLARSAAAGSHGAIGLLSGFEGRQRFQAVIALP